MTLPRHDFYQTESHVIAAVYLKGYAQADVEVGFEPFSTEATQYKFEPLFALTIPQQSSFRVLSTKIEFKLAKASGGHWPSLVSSNPSLAPSTLASSSRPTPPTPPIKAQKPNWDKLVATELEEKETADPNAGGDAALQKMFAQIYAGADEDTKRAMIKSFTESGGTTLSTDWSSIGKDGMVEKKF